MDSSTVALMREQVRAIYRAATGAELSEGEQGSGERAEEAAPDEVARRFADLEAIARSIPAVAERVPPFSFEPLLDVSESQDALLVELAVPGVAPGDVAVERRADLLVIRGLRRGDSAARGQVYLHAEIPRGPFRRELALPFPTEEEPSVRVERGVISIRLARKRSA